ncbi:hypothetical protein [Tessaracoccus flavus]|uniref:hypothetical protein n=1 Tax=Tessaracoccus flavus TaxID=1610493 RepID=UPI001D045CE9|nr:hypothetical protein [Tessaracoccus flavus]
MPIRRTVPWLVSTVSPSMTAENVTGISAGSLDLTGSAAAGDADGDTTPRSEAPASDGDDEALGPSAPV